MVAKATAIDVFSMTRSDSIPSAAKRGTRRCAKAGSPIQLGGREEDVEAPLERGHEARLPVALRGERRHPRRPHPHHGDLRGDEESVHHDERQGERDEQGVGDHPRRARTRTGMLEERRPGRQAPLHDTPAGRVYAARGQAENAAGGGCMRRGVAVGMGCALLLAGVAVHARGERELTNDELRAEMAKNRTLAAYVARNGEPDVA